EGADNDQEKAPRESAATAMVRLALEKGAQPFHDPDRLAYLTVPSGDHKETWRLRSKSAQQWLARPFYREPQKAPRGQAAADAVAVREGNAGHDGPECPVHVRLAGHGGAIYLDLGDPAWRAVRVDANGWRVVPDAPVKFRRPRGLLPLPEPARGGKVA